VTTKDQPESGMKESAPRPSLRSIVVTLAVIAAIQLFDLVTHQDVLTALITIVICGAYIGWWVWSHRYQ
jgi:Flp pilus assembly protein TadB